MMFMRLAAMGGVGGMVVSATDSDYKTNDGTVYSFTSTSFGAAVSNRYILVGIAYKASDSPTLTVSIGGVSATAITGTSRYAVGVKTQFFIANVPTGTSGTVTVTGTVSGLRCYLATWRITGLNSTTAVDTAGSSSFTVNAPADTIDVSAGGCIFGVSQNGKDNTWLRGSSAHRQYTGATSGVSVATTGASGSITWTSLTKQFDDLCAEDPLDDASILNIVSLR